MSKRAFVTLLVTFKLFAVALTAASTPATPTVDIDAQYGEGGTCMPWEGCESSGS